MELPDELIPVLTALRSVGRPRIVGGAVRDWLLGLPAKDLDLEVGGASFGDLHRVLAPLGATDVVGRSFGVIKLRLASGVEYDISLPRRESKTGAGHRGFAVEPDATLSDAEAAARRDFTVNAIAWDPVTRVLIDPHGGEADLRAGRLRHTSAAFAEDPLRVLRGMQLAGRFGFTLDAATAELGRQIFATYSELPVERVWHEWAKWAEKSARPSCGLAVLVQTGWLAHFPELAALVGCPQDPGWHPEGDVWVHTGFTCDALAADPEWLAASPGRRLRLMLAALLHDVGKPGCTRQEEKAGQLRWVSPGHEPAGVPLAEAFLRRIGAPHDHAAAITPLIANHMVHHHGGPEGLGDNAIRRLARRLHPATIADLALIMRADSNGRPPLHSPETLALVERLRRRADELALVDGAPRPILLGRHLIAAGLKPGPEFKALLDTAFNAQLDGAFGDESGALIWLRKHLPVAGA
ncbi:MAG: HD domain-containing protein [Verrucomicrobia bacterium]|nr:HD domain-containing protein [Verrucomicrobiota bacterium]